MGAQIIRFCVVGGLATLVHLAIATALVHAGAQLGVWGINLIAFAGAFWVSFLGHRHFTFGSEGSVGKFLVAGITGLAVNNICLTVVFWLTKADLASIIIAALASPAAVYLISRYWVFK